MFAALDASMATGDGHAMVEDLAVNAWLVRPGSVFFCIRGSGVDGHDWADEAVANGAVALVVERQLDLPAPQILVPDARAALAAVSAEYWGRPTETLPIVGITGTSGKTTTAYLLHSILEAAGLRPGLWGTIETQIGSERAPTGLWSPVAFHLQGAFRSMLDAGNLSCVIEATSYDSDLRRLDAHPLRGARLHEPRPRPPRLPRHVRRLFRSEASALPGSELARSDQRRRRVRPAAPLRASRAR